MVETVGRQERIVQSNHIAQDLGIQKGQQRAAAQALAGSLRVVTRQPQQEAAFLENLACWAMQFTPAVSIALPATLLLEIEGCLNYFGGLHRLQHLIEQGLAGLDLLTSLAIAPTPLAATWRAHAGESLPVLMLAELPHLLSQLPLVKLPWPAELQHKLQSLGLRRLADVMVLPRAGLGRRFGQALPQMLAQAIGESPDPRQTFVPPDYFVRTIELNWSTDQIEALVFVVKRLQAGLGAYLLGRGLGVQQLTLQFQHDNKTQTDLIVGMGKPTRCADTMLSITRERLAKFSLVAPVCAVRLLADDLHRLDSEAIDLFGDYAHAGDISLLLARMRARLGEQAICQLTSPADHRPEKAWHLGIPSPSPTIAGSERPSWLFPKPIKLEVRHGKLWYDEYLTPITGAERIEAGWHNGQRVARDYQQAVGASGRRYWIFLRRQDAQWYVHGLFA